MCVRNKAFHAVVCHCGKGTLRDRKPGSAHMEALGCWDTRSHSMGDAEALKGLWDRFERSEPESKRPVRDLETSGGTGKNPSVLVLCHSGGDTALRW